MYVCMCRCMYTERVTVRIGLPLAKLCVHVLEIQ